MSCSTTRSSARTGTDDTFIPTCFMFRTLQDKQYVLHLSYSCHLSGHMKQVSCRREFTMIYDLVKYPLLHSTMSSESHVSTTTNKRRQHLSLLIWISVRTMTFPKVNYVKGLWYSDCLKNLHLKFYSLTMLTIWTIGINILILNYLCT